MQSISPREGLWQLGQKKTAASLDAAVQYVLYVTKFLRSCEPSWMCPWSGVPGTIRWKAVAC